MSRPIFCIPCKTVAIAVPVVEAMNACAPAALIRASCASTLMVEEPVVLVGDERHAGIDEFRRFDQETCKIVSASWPEASVPLRTAIFLKPRARK